MTVAELLSTVDSFELTEWQAYEQAFGPLGNAYSDDVLAAIHEQLQTLNYLTGSQCEENPVPMPRHWPRPPEAFIEYLHTDPDDEVVSQDEFDTMFD